MLRDVVHYEKRCMVVFHMLQVSDDSLSECYSPVISQTVRMSTLTAAFHSVCVCLLKQRYGELYQLYIVRVKS